MAATNNGNWLSGLTNWINERNAAQREMNVRDAAIRRGADGGRKDETGLPKLDLVEGIAGLRGPEAQREIQRQTSSNETARIVEANITSDPSLGRLSQVRQGGEDDLAYNMRRLSEQDSEIAIKKAIEAGVPLELVRTDTRLTPAQVDKITNTYNENQGLIKLIRNEELGPKLLATLREKNGGNRLTGDQLSGVLSEARGKDPLRVSRLETEQTTREVNRDRQTLSELQREDTNKLNNSTIDYNNTKLEYDWKTANANRDYEFQRDEADRELKKTLSMLGLEDKADARRERSEERSAEQRQLFILQLMKGLGQLGQSVGGGY